MEYKLNITIVITRMKTNHIASFYLVLSIIPMKENCLLISFPDLLLQPYYASFSSAYSDFNMDFRMNFVMKFKGRMGRM